MRKKKAAAAPIPRRPALTAAAAFAFATLPYSFVLDFEGLLQLRPAFAHADQGGGNSGPGGGDDDEDDDNSGPGGGGDDHDDDDEDDEDDEDEGEDDEDDGDEEAKGTGAGGGTAGGNPRGTGCQDGSGGARGACAPPRSAIVRIEASRSGIEIRYADGTRERIRQGRYQRRNAGGGVVEDRRATGADVTRLRALAQSATIESVAAETDAAPTRSVSSDRREAEVRYANGWAERIKDGRYELIDPYGRTVVRRPATAEDMARVAGRP
jgi:hypothetical protein